MVCGAPITAKFWACQGCERAYGLDRPYSQWPDWAKALQKEEQRERTYNAHWHEYAIVSLDEAGLDLLVNGGLNDDPISEPISELMFN